MGTYCYTMRKGTRLIDGHEIGRFAFSYKDGSFFNGRQRRAVAASLAAAERARYAHPDVRWFISGEFKDARQERLAVFDIGTRCDSYFDGLNPGPVVGYIEAIGRGYRFIPVVEQAAA